MGREQVQLSVNGLAGGDGCTSQRMAGDQTMASHVQGSAVREACTRPVRLLLSA